jgi:hypothetical protein
MMYSTILRQESLHRSIGFHAACANEQQLAGIGVMGKFMDAGLV